MPPKPWTIIDSTKDRSFRVFSLRTDRALSPRTGRPYDFFVLESSPWVNEIPRLIRERYITHSLVIVAFYRFFMEYLPVGRI